MRFNALTFSSLALLAGMTSLGTAQSPSRPHLDLVRGLRNEHMSDLALQYLNSLKTAKLDPATQQLMDVEYARTWLELAADETDEGKRATLIADAKRKLEAFIAANPKHPVSAQANSDLARLYSVQGKSQIRKARRFEDQKERESAMKAARIPLLAAADKYKKTAAAIDEQIKKLETQKGAANEKLRRELIDFRMNAQLDEGITLYYLAETYIGEETKDITEQGTQYKNAKKIFERIRYEDEKLPIRWVAMAWSAQADLKAGDAGASDRTLADLFLKKDLPTASAGIRVARYFAILNNLDTKKDYAAIEKEAEAWLKDYPSQKDSPEGLGCRYYLASAKRNLAIPGLIRDKKDGKLIGINNAAKLKLEQAQLLFKELAESENEYAERSSRNRSQILVTIADAEGHGDAPPLESLTTFDRAVLMAQVQIARFATFRAGGGKTPPSEDAIKKEESFRFAKAILYLEHALKLANPAKDSLRDIFAAQWTLVTCYYELHLYPQAAVLAEHLARENPKMTNAPRAGSVAVAMYNQSQIELKKLKEKAAEPKDETQRKQAERMWDDGVKADLEHARRAAVYMIKQWPNDSLTDESRHLLARQAFLNKQYHEALKTYIGIRNGYAGVHSARLELASVLFVLVLPDEKDPVKFKQIKADRLKQYEGEWKQTIALLESLSAPEENSVNAATYLDNRAQLARLYQLEDNQERAIKIGELILAETDKFSNLNEAQKIGFKQIGHNLVLNGIRAQAVQEFKMGNHARVAELLDPLIVEITKEFDKKAPDEPTQTYERLRKTQREVVVLALQSSVQDGKIDRASDLLDLLEKSGGGAEESLGLLQTLVSSVRGQLDELEAAVKKASLDPKGKEEVAAKTKEAASLKEGFAKLLEKLTARGDQLPVRMRLFLASGLSTVGAFDQATDELEKIRKIPAPVKPAGATEDQEAEFKVASDDYKKYQHQAQYMMARNYRQKKDYAKALAVFKEMIGETSPKAAKDKPRGWAFASLQVRKDRAMMFEEMALGETTAAEKLKRWGEAVQEWNGISVTFAPRLEPLRQNLPPLDEARKIFFTIVKLPRDEADEGFCLLDLAWLAHQYGPNFAKEREKAAAEAQATAAKRERYFELFFEIQRCSVLAYKNLGTAATKGSAEALQEKFAKLAKSFVELQSKTKNPDLPDSIKERIKELVDSVPELKKEYSQLVAK